MFLEQVCMPRHSYRATILSPYIADFIALFLTHLLRLCYRQALLPKTPLLTQLLRLFFTVRGLCPLNPPFDPVS